MYPSTTTLVWNVVYHEIYEMMSWHYFFQTLCPVPKLLGTIHGFKNEPLLCGPQDVSQCLILLLLVGTTRCCTKPRRSSFSRHRSSMLLLMLPLVGLVLAMFNVCEDVWDDDEAILYQRWDWFNTRGIMRKRRMCVFQTATGATYHWTLMPLWAGIIAEPFFMRIQY